MSVLIVGTTALDSIKTPTGKIRACSAARPAMRRSRPVFFRPSNWSAAWAKIFRRNTSSFIAGTKLISTGLQILPGKTFHWSGEYEVNMNNRRTLATELGVIETFQPVLPAAYQNSPFVLLGNIAPALQHRVLDQMKKPKFVVADSMDLWLNIALTDLLKLLPRIDGFVLNDSEAHQLTKEDNVFAALKKIHKLGPKYVIIKKGSHGSIFPGRKDFSSARRIRCTRWWTRPARAIPSSAA